MTAVVAAGLSAQELKAVRVEKGPRIDGRLDDPAWQAATAIDGFRMVEPRPGEAPSERTEVRIVYDAHSLYIGVHCLDSEPDRIAANTMAHDSGGDSGGMGRYYYGHHGSSISSDDLVRVLLDPFQDKRTAYVFFVNPRGARGEGLVYAGDASLNWDGIWEAEASRPRRRLVRRDAHPVQDDLVPPRPDAWGINVERTIARKHGDHPAVRDEPRQQLQQPDGGGRPDRDRGRQAGPGHHLPALRPGQRREGQPTFRAPTREARRRVRHLQELHPQPGRRRQLQHGLRRDRGRRAAHQPDPLPAVLPREADVLPRGLGDLQLQLEHQLHALLQPHDRALSTATRSPSSSATKLYGKVGNTNLAILDVQTGHDSDVDGRPRAAGRTSSPPG